MFFIRLLTFTASLLVSSSAAKQQHHRNIRSLRRQLQVPPTTTHDSFSALTISKDGVNLFQEDLLNEIRQRMEIAENTRVRRLEMYTRKNKRLRLTDLFRTPAVTGRISRYHLRLGGRLR